MASLLTLENIHKTFEAGTVNEKPCPQRIRFRG